MRATVIASALLASVAFAKPVAKPAVATETTWVTEVVHVYVDAAEATPPPQAAPAPAPATEQKKQDPKPEEKKQDLKPGEVMKWRYEWSRNEKGEEYATTITEIIPAQTPAPESAPEQSYAPAQEQPQQQPEEKPEDDKPEEKPQEQPQEQPQDSYQPPAPSGSYKQKCMDHHNMHRLNHSAPALQWSDELESIAQTTANTCFYAHDTKTGGGGYGQNIAAGVDADNIGYVITGQFYNDEFDFYPGFGSDAYDKSKFEKWGHLSQILWKDTTHFACVTKDCTAQGLGGEHGGSAPHFTVCNYKGAGNVAGGYAENVLEPRGDAFFGVTF